MTRRLHLTLALALAIGGFAPGCSDMEGSGLGGVELSAGADESTAMSEGEGQVSTEPGGETTPPEVVEPIEETITPDLPEPEPEEEAPLSIAQVLPNQGLASGGEQIEIIGTKFGYGLRVFFGESLSEDVFVLDETRLIAVTPPRIPGLVDVTLAYPDDGESVTLEEGFLFYNPTTVIDVEPANGHVMGGEPVTITGTGFLQATDVLIGGRTAIQVEIVDDNTILAVTPDGAAPGAVDVHVCTPDGIGTLGDGYTYFENPRVDAVVPAVGLAGGGYKVEVRGAGFEEPVVVTFGVQQLIEAERIDANTITGIVPAADAGSVDVIVSTAYGSAVGFDAFTYLDTMDSGTTVELLAVTPGSGPSAGGGQATLVAKGLTSSEDTTVMFGDVPAQIMGVDVPGHVVLVEVPAGAEGTVDVTLKNSNGEDSLAGAYTYQSFMRVYDVSEEEAEPDEEGDATE